MPGTSRALAAVIVLVALDAAHAMPPDADIRECEQQAQAAAAPAPSASPRSQPYVSRPGDARERAPSSGAVRRRATPAPTEPDRGTETTALQRESEGRDAYRVAFEACLRARGL
jgi:hypothetical protein